MKERTEITCGCGASWSGTPWSTGSPSDFYRAHEACQQENRDSIIAAERKKFAELIEQLGTVYRREGIGLWLFGKNDILNGDRPIDLLKRGEIEQLCDLIDLMASGAYS